MSPYEINKDSYSPRKRPRSTLGEHFKDVLNRPAPEEEPDIPEAEEDLSVDTRPPKKEEIIAAINSLTNHIFPAEKYY